MSNPLWLDDLFGGLMVAVAVYSVGRLVTAQAWSRPSHRDIDVAHVLMGAAMAGQLVSDLNPIPNGVWEVVFVALALWFLWRCYEFARQPGSDGRYGTHVHRLARRVIHLMMALAMLYMYLAAVPAEVVKGMAMGTATGATANFVFIPTIFIFTFLASAVWTLENIGRFTPSGHPPLRTRTLISVGRETPSSDRATSREDCVLAEANDLQASGPDTSRWLAPRLEEGAHIVMVVTMAYMLVLML